MNTLSLSNKDLDSLSNEHLQVQYINKEKI